MYRLTILAVLSVLLGLATAVAEPAAKPTDPQIAHIAYTAGQLDIEASRGCRRGSAGGIQTGPYASRRRRSQR